MPEDCVFLSKSLPGPKSNSMLGMTFGPIVKFSLESLLAVAKNQLNLPVAFTRGSCERFITRRLYVVIHATIQVDHHLLSYFLADLKHVMRSEHRLMKQRHKGSPARVLVTEPTRALLRLPGAYRIH